MTVELYTTLDGTEGTEGIGGDKGEGKEGGMGKGEDGWGSRSKVQWMKKRVKGADSGSGQRGMVDLGH